MNDHFLGIMANCQISYKNRPDSKKVVSYKHLKRHPKTKSFQSNMVIPIVSMDMSVSVFPSSPHHPQTVIRFLY